MPKHSYRWHNGAVTVKSGHGGLIAAVLKAGSADASATIYDGTSTGGVIMCTLTALAGTSVSAFFGEGGIVFNTGLHMVPAGGGGASCSVVYD